MKLPSSVKIGDYLQQEFTFETAEAFETFIRSQIAFWSERQSIASQSSIANSYIQRCNGFVAVLNHLDSLRPQLEGWDAATFQSNITNVIASYINHNWIWSGHSFVEKWLELIDESINVADAFFEAIVQKSTTRYANGIDFFQGYVIAYEYVNQGNSGISKRRSSEAKSLERLRSELADKQSELISKVSIFQEEIDDWKDGKEQKLSELMISKEKCLDDTNVYHSKSFHEQYANWSNSIAELENKFKEKLRFASPANYWNTRAGRLKKQGYFWVSTLILTIVSSVIWFSNYFLAWLIGGKPTKLGIDSIEGLLIFAAILSSMAFLIKSLSRLTFSSFHLMRDAEEREQLTHLYLSLRDGKEDDPEARKIILQSLFSRSETGLLNGEHGPTMPTATEIFSVLGKGK